MAALIPIDTLDIRVLVNDQLDNIAPSWNDHVSAPGRFSHVPFRSLNGDEKEERGNAQYEMHLPSSCCGAHGLSLMITVGKGESKHTMMFDAGPEGDVWVKNVTRLGLEKEVGQVETIHLSHWHRDHSGGLEKAIALINAHKPEGSRPLTVDLHPDRPSFRGMMTPRGPITLEADPTFAQLEAAGAQVKLNNEAHSILEQMVYVSGEIPRNTNYETGFPNGIRLDKKEIGWEQDTEIKDERFIMCNLKGKGLVVFTGCSHAGVVNVMKHAVEVGGDLPLFAIVGGFHLSDANEQKLESTMADLKVLQPTIIMPGHCTGWRFLVESEKILPGRAVPLYCGQKYGLTSLMNVEVPEI